MTRSGFILKDNTKLTGFEETLRGSLVDSPDSGWGQVVSIYERDNGLRRRFGISWRAVGFD